MIVWKTLDSRKSLRQLIDRSRYVPTVIFKHSTRCGVSHFAKKQLERDWDLAADAVDVYYLDLVAHRDVSNDVSIAFDVRHESPQILLIRDGESIYDTSHQGVSVQAIKKALAGNNNNGSER
ncbi:MAG: bacillithiol system redox-active protein YtxJ [Candidatus Krumholzibacteria bacterium]|nr:bacillithiol system redox-active protein YtxJ [Candidatus Krumholzibacteria bacterium]